MSISAGFITDENDSANKVEVEINMFKSRLDC